MAGFQRTGNLKFEIQGQTGCLGLFLFWFPLFIDNSSCSGFGEADREVSIYSSTRMVLGGQEHELPIIIVNYIETLYCIGKKTMSRYYFWLTQNLKDIPTKLVSNSSKLLSSPRTYQHLRRTTSRKHLIILMWNLPSNFVANIVRREPKKHLSQRSRFVYGGTTIKDI